MAHTIDLTFSDADDSDESDGDTGGDTGDGDGDGDDRGEGTDDLGEDTDDEKKNGNKKNNGNKNGANRRKTLAKKFVQKMDALRESRIKVKKTKSVSKKKSPAKKKPAPNKVTAKKQAVANNKRTRANNKRTRGRQSDGDVNNTPSKKNKNLVGESSPTRWKERPILGQLRVGGKISGQWNQDDEHKGEWYDGIVKSINKANETVHVVYDDGDEDDELKWTDLRILG